MTTSPRLRGEVAARSDAGEGTSVNSAVRRVRRPRVSSAQVERSRELRADSQLAEEKLWAKLRGRRYQGLKFRRQYAIGNYIADFACTEAGLIIEVDGTQHAFSRTEDAQRTRDLNALGFQVLRFWTIDVMTRMDQVLIEISEVISLPSPGAGAPTSPRKRGEVKAAR